jgi:hypothetical protein
VEERLFFEDGETLKADVVVFATCLDSNLKNQVSELFGKETAEKWEVGRDLIRRAKLEVLIGREDVRHLLNLLI